MEYWVDVAGEDCEEAMKHLKVMTLFLLMVQKYAIRKKVKIQDISHVIVVHSIQTQYGVDCKEGMIFDDLQSGVELFESEEFPGQKETDVIAFADPRTSFLGVRVLCGIGSLEMEDQSI